MTEAAANLNEAIRIRDALLVMVLDEIVAHMDAGRLSKARAQMTDLCTLLRRPEPPTPERSL